MRKFMAALAALSLVCAASQAQAGAVTGTLRSVHVSQAGNMPFRIEMNLPSTGSPYTDCIGGILYVDVNNANYQVFVSALMLAYSQGKQVALNYSPGMTPGGQTIPACVIGEVTVF